MIVVLGEKWQDINKILKNTNLGFFLGSSVGVIPELIAASKPVMPLTKLMTIIQVQI